jgi:LDH2 family malate/lactate/ureidoglycolate dehydrogenase
VPTIAADILIRITSSLLESANIPAPEAKIVANSLVESNLRGHDSHGVLRIPQYLQLVRDGKIVPGAPFTIIDESPALVAADAGWGLGQVQAHRLIDLLIPKARALGVAVGTLRHCGHTGRIGEYAERSAQAQMAFIGMVNTHGAGNRVAPPGGTAPRLSTNPICMGAPTGGDPVILDMATTVCAEGKVRAAFQKGEQAPEGWLLDAAGHATTDPGVLYKQPLGTILPLGGSAAYKGFGLGFIIDALTGGLSGGMCSHPDVAVAYGNCVLFILIDTARFGGAKHFAGEVTRLAEHVRSCPRAEGFEAVLIPGDPELLSLSRRRSEGIPIPEPIWQRLLDCAANAGVPINRLTPHA